eukprot:s4180_g15.t1
MCLGSCTTKVAGSHQDQHLAPVRNRILRHGDTNGFAGPSRSDGAEWLLSLPPAFSQAAEAVGSQGVSRNQIFVIECLQKHNGKNLMNAGLMLDRVRQLIQNFTSTDSAGMRVERRAPEMLKRPSPDGWRPQDGELVYYASCLDLLVGIAEGRSNNLINKPFVSDIFSSIHALALLNKVQPVEDVTPVAVDWSRDHLKRRSSDIEVTRHLRTRWLHLLQLLLYDVDKTLYDTSLMSSPSHFEFLEP